MPTLIETHKEDFERVVTHLESELKNIRSGRASTSLVESIPIEAYGSMMDLKSSASITTPDAKTIQIEPWDKELVKAIEKALVAADLGMQPTVAGTVIRLNMPPMTEENRQKQSKQVHEKAEASHISLRNVREKIREEITKKEKNKEIGEDEKRRLQEALDKRVKEVNERIESVAEKKVADIMTI